MVGSRKGGDNTRTSEFIRLSGFQKTTSSLWQKRDNIILIFWRKSACRPTRYQLFKAGKMLSCFHTVTAKCVKAEK